MYNKTIIKVMKNHAGPALDPWPPPSQAGPAQDPWPPKPSRPGPGPLAPQAKPVRPRTLGPSDSKRNNRGQ